MLQLEGRMGRGRESEGHLSLCAFPLLCCARGAHRLAAEDTGSAGTFPGAARVFPFANMAPNVD